jgi:hypothetical protein
MNDSVVMIAKLITIVSRITIGDRIMPKNKTIILSALVKIPTVHFICKLSARARV